MNFKDHFSTQAKLYAKYRPHYPHELYDFLFSIVPGLKLAWDCATGNGQVAVQLAKRFEQVIATDASESQINNATPAERVTYKVEPAEKTSFANQSVELITVAQALHWFDHDRFFAEVKRVLAPCGIIAVWTYEHFMLPAIPDRLVLKYHDEILKGFWPPERKHVGTRYEDIPFPFEEIETPPFQMKHRWKFEQLLGYLGSWSASQNFYEAKGYNPLDEIRDELLSHWGNPEETKEITWNIPIKVGRN